MSKHDKKIPENSITQTTKKEEPEVNEKIDLTPEVSEESKSPDKKIEPKIDLKPEVSKPKVIKTEGQAFQIEIESRLKAYVSARSQCRTEGDLGAIQHGFFQFLRKEMSNKKHSEFKVRWNFILDYMDKNRETYFNDRQMLAGAAGWTGSSLEFSMFRRLGYIMISTSNRSERKANLSSINFDLGLKGFKQQERDNLMFFYSR